MIHPTAVIHPKAQIGEGTVVGPFAIIDEHVVMGSECIIGPHAHVTGHTTMGRGNKLHQSAALGDWPQDLRYKGERTELRIGDNNVFREFVTIHRSNSPVESTVIGSNNYFMAGSHVGHNASIGNNVIMANGAGLAGHVTVGDKVFMSAYCMVHQFVRIGTLAFMQGGSGVTKDLPPYTVSRNNNRICGLNTIGLRRAGLTSEERLELRALYQLVFRRGKKFREAIEEAAQKFLRPPSLVMLEFLRTTKRGVVPDVSRGNGSAEED